MSGIKKISFSLTQEDVEGRIGLSPNLFPGGAHEAEEYGRLIFTEFNQHSIKINTAVFSPDGNHLITLSLDNTTKLWDWDGNILAALNHTDKVWGAVFSPDSSHIATFSDDKTAKLWDSHGNLLADLIKHTAPVATAAFIDNGKRIFTVSKDGAVKRWYTPEAIMETLKTSALLQLTKEQKETLGIADF